LSNAIKQMRDATAASSSSSVDLTAVSTNIIPDTDVTYDLGSSTHKFKDLYLDGNTLNLGNQTIKATATGIEVPELKIGTGTNTVKLTVASDGKLTTTETDSSGNTSSPAAAGGGGSSVTVSDTAPTSPSAGDQWFDSSSLIMFVYYADGSSSQWVPATPAGQTGATGADGTAGYATVVTDMAGLVAITGMVAGQTALVTALNKVFMYTGTAWYLIATMTNASPTSITGVDATYDLATDGTATTITAVSTDPEGFPLTWSYAVTTGSLGSTATVSQADNVFTITPSTTEADAGSFSITFSVTDGATGAVNAVSAFTLAFTSWATPSLQSSIVPGGFNIDGVAGLNDDAGAHGMSLSQDMNHLVISGKDKTISTQNSSYWNYDGSIRYYTRSGNTWTLQQYFNGPTPPSAVLTFGNQYGQRFGQGVTISGDGSTFVCASSAWQAATTTGSAIHIYTRSGNTWTLQETIPSGSSTWSTNQDYGGRLGSFEINEYKGKTFATPLALSYDGSFLAIGSPDFNTTPGTGAVHTFTRSGSTWSFEQYITGPDTRFGHGVAYAEDTQTLMIGDARHPDTSNWPNLYGGLGFYRRNGSGVWSVDQTVVSTNAGDFLGGSCTISKDGMTAAAGGNNDSTTQMVSVYVNDGTANGGNWTLQQRFRNSDWADIDGKFGSIVQLSNDGDTLMVAAKNQDATIDSTLYTYAGRIYVFKRTGTTWTETGIIDLPSGDQANSRNLGQKCVLSSDASLIFASSNGTSNNGAIHIYEEG